MTSLEKAYFEFARIRDIAGVCLMADGDYRKVMIQIMIMAEQEVGRIYPDVVRREK